MNDAMFALRRVAPPVRGINMANFRVYPGKYLIVAEDFANLQKGQVLQILHARYFITFVGINGTYPLSGPWEPFPHEHYTWSPRDNAPPKTAKRLWGFLSGKN